jgi:adenine-specific DNA methylase
MKNEFEQKIPTVKKININHLNRQIAPEAHTPMYNFHKYWSRKTWNVIGKFIETYCPKNSIVFDPFGGSGVTAIEALKIGRKVIISDISPLATELTRLTILPVEEIKLVKAFKNIEKKVKNKILDLYKTKCRKCNKEIIFNCAIWKGNNCVEIRYKKCQYCGDERRKNTKLLDFDSKLLKNIKNHNITEWYPKNELYHINGKPFKEKQQFESLDELFTKRNLYALAIIMEAIEEEQNKEIKAFLKIGFTSIVHLCTKMNPDF